MGSGNHSSMSRAPITPQPFQTLGGLCEQQRRHDPIALEDTWATKWWPNRQFTFTLSVSEANAVQSRARARREQPEPQLQFCRQLGKLMLTNQLDSEGNCPKSPVRLRKRGRESNVNPHENIRLSHNIPENGIVPLSVIGVL